MDSDQNEQPTDQTDQPKDPENPEESGIQEGKSQESTGEPRTQGVHYSPETANKDPDIIDPFQMTPKSQEDKPKRVFGGKQNNQHKMNPKHIALTKAFMDPNSPTYGNKVKSYQSVYGVKNYKGASASACAILDKPRNVDLLQQILTEQGLDIENRVVLLRQIIRGGAERKTKQYRLRKDGSKVQTHESTHEPTFAERAKALDILNKLTGDYEKVKAQVDLDKAGWKALRKQIMAGFGGTLNTEDTIKQVEPTDDPLTLPSDQQ